MRPASVQPDLLSPALYPLIEATRPVTKLSERLSEWDDTVDGRTALGSDVDEQERFVLQVRERDGRLGKLDLVNISARLFVLFVRF